MGVNYLTRWAKDISEPKPWIHDNKPTNFDIKYFVGAV